MRATAESIPASSTREPRVTQSNRSRGWVVGKGGAKETGGDQIQAVGVRPSELEAPEASKADQETGITRRGERSAKPSLRSGRERPSLTNQLD